MAPWLGPIINAGWIETSVHPRLQYPPQTPPVMVIYFSGAVAMITIKIEIRVHQAVYLPQTMPAAAASFWLPVPLTIGEAHRMAPYGRVEMAWTTPVQADIDCQRRLNWIQSGSTGAVTVLPVHSDLPWNWPWQVFVAISADHLAT